jgi:hypothetical protein
MPGDSPDSSEKVIRFFIDERGFLSLPPLYLLVVILLQLPSITKIDTAGEVISVGTSRLTN